MVAVSLLSCTAHPTSASPKLYVRCLVCLQSFAQLSYSFLYEDMFIEHLSCTRHCSQHMLMPVILCLLASLFTYVLEYAFFHACMTYN